MRAIEVKGKTIEEAIESGLKDLDTTRDKVDVEVLEESKTGLFGIMGSSLAKVRLVLKDEIVDYSILLDDVLFKIKQVLNLMNFNLDVKGTVFGGRIMVEINGEDTKFIIGRSGEVLNAFEDLINFMVSKEQRNKVKIEIDVDNYRGERAEKLVCMLKNIVENVLKTEKSYKLQAMCRRDRKTVHNFVDKYKDLESISQGQGRDRFIVISKKNKISFE